MGGKILEQLVQTLLQAVLEALLKLGWVKAGSGENRVAKCPRCGSIRIKRATGRWFWVIAFVPLVLGIVLWSMLTLVGLTGFLIGLLNLIGAVDTTGGASVLDLLYMLGGMVAVIVAMVMWALWSGFITSKEPVACQDCKYRWPRASRQAAHVEEALDSRGPRSSERRRADARRRFEMLASNS